MSRFGNGEEQERLRFQSGKKEWGFDLAISGLEVRGFDLEEKGLDLDSGTGEEEKCALEREEIFLERE